MSVGIDDVAKFLHLLFAHDARRLCNLGRFGMRQLARLGRFALGRL